MKRTFQPNNLRRKRTHGFRERMKTLGGRQVLKRRRARGRIFSMRAGVHLMQKKKFTLKKLNRLKSKKSFQIVYVKGRTVVDAMSVFYILPDQGEDIKIGLAVG